MISSSDFLGNDSSNDGKQIFAVFGDGFCLPSAVVLFGICCLLGKLYYKSRFLWEMLVIFLLLFFRYLDSLVIRSVLVIDSVVVLEKIVHFLGLLLQRYFNFISIIKFNLCLYYNLNGLYYITYFYRMLKF